MSSEQLFPLDFVINVHNFFTLLSLFIRIIHFTFTLLSLSFIHSHSEFLSIPDILSIYRQYYSVYISDASNFRSLVWSWFEAGVSGRSIIIVNRYNRSQTSLIRPQLTSICWIALNLRVLPCSIFLHFANDHFSYPLTLLTYPFPRFAFDSCLLQTLPKSLNVKFPAFVRLSFKYFVALDHYRAHHFCPPLRPNITTLVITFQLWHFHLYNNT